MDAPNALPPEIKRINRSRIFRFLYEQGPHARREIAQALRLSSPTVVQNLREMEEQGLILEAGVLASTGGRKAVAVALNYNAKYAIGLDLTQTHISMVVLNLHGDVLFQVRRRSIFRLTPAYFSDIKALLDQAMDQLQIEQDRILGVGISVPAIISEAGNQLEYAVILSQEMSTEHFSHLFSYDCRFCNDAKAACRAEQWANGAQGDFIYLCLSNSVGGAIVQHSQLSVGQNRRSAEFGHMTIEPNGRMCYCGQRGCIDAYCNAKLLSRHTDGNLDAFFQQVQAGEPAATAEWDTYLEYLAIVVNNLRMSFDDTVVLGGYVGCYMGPYLERLQAMVAERNTFCRSGEFLKKCYYDQFEASAVGAALLYIEPFLAQI